MRDVIRVICFLTIFVLTGCGYVFAADSPPLVQVTWDDPVDITGVETYRIYMINVGQDYEHAALIKDIPTDSNEHTFTMPLGIVPGKVCVVMTSYSETLGESEHSDEACGYYSHLCPPTIKMIEVKR